VQVRQPVKDSPRDLGVWQDLRVTAQSSRIRRLGPEFVAEHRRRYGKRPPECRQLTYDIAARDDYAPWRQWLDDQLALLSGQTSEALARKVWLDEHFWTVNFELAAGAGLRAAGLSVAYEQAWDGVSPDWTVLSEQAEPLAFVEVITDMPSQETFAQMRAWHGLVERIKEIPVPVMLCGVARRAGPAAGCPAAGQQGGRDGHAAGAADAMGDHRAQAAAASKSRATVGPAGPR
jgi:hypothetical protein